MHTTFQSLTFYDVTMSSVKQSIDQGELVTLDQVMDYLNDEALFYARKATDQVLIQVLPDDLTELNRVYGTLNTKEDLAFCALSLWMDLNEMYQDAQAYFIKNLP